MKTSIIVVFLFINNLFAQLSTIYGSLFDFNGNSLSNEKIVLSALSDTVVNSFSDVNNKGGFNLKTEKSGIVFLEFAADGHQSFKVALFLQGKEKIGFNVYLVPNDSLSAILNINKSGNGKKASKIIFNKNNSFNSSFSANYDSILLRRKKLSLQLAEYRNQGKDLRDFEMNWSEDTAALIVQIRKETNKILRQELLFSYLDIGYGIYGAELDDSIVNLALTEIPYNSPLWSIEPSNIGIALNNLTEPQKYYVYLKKIIKLHPDENVRTTVKNGFSPDRKILKGKIFPTFSIKSLVDSLLQITNKSLKGKYTLIDFWATWCKPCIEEMPNLHDIYDSYHSKNFEILSISLDKERELPLNFRKTKWKMPWLNGFLGLNKKQMDYFEISGIPKTVLLDTNGKIIASDYELRGKNLRRTINKFIK